jgi:hypothetical protein
VTATAGVITLHLLRDSILRVGRNVESNSLTRLLVQFVMIAAVGSSCADDPPRDVFPIRLDRRRVEHLARPDLDAEIPRDLPAGGLAEAREYYAELALQLDLPAAEPPRDLQQLLDYFGYAALSPRQLDGLAPDVLMSPKELQRHLAEGADPSSWSLLAARYFSPKTSDVSGRSNNLSWRKIVRLLARPDSPAEQNGLNALYFLSVTYAGLAGIDENPFEAPSLSIQVMLTRRVTEPADAVRLDTAYWLVFEPQRDYLLGHATQTSWDAADPALVDPHGLRPYFVPTACINCHGGARKQGMTQFFDTDSILDRVRPGDDFEALSASPWAALFDCGADPSTEEHRRGFEVFRQLNTEILAQNQAVSDQSLIAAGAANWVRLHAASNDYIPPQERAWLDLGRQPAAPHAAFERALPLLNRFCYRCHGSIDYSIYDQAGLLAMPDRLVERLEDPELTNRMPIDRNLPEQFPAEYEQLLEALRPLLDGHATSN